MTMLSSNDNGDNFKKRLEKRAYKNRLEFIKNHQKEFKLSDKQMEEVLIKLK